MILAKTSSDTAQLLATWGKTKQFLVNKHASIYKYFHLIYVPRIPHTKNNSPFIFRVSLRGSDG